MFRVTKFQITNFKIQYPESCIQYQVSSIQNPVSSIRLSISSGCIFCDYFFYRFHHGDHFIPQHFFLMHVLPDSNNCGIIIKFSSYLSKIFFACTVGSINPKAGHFTHREFFSRIFIQVFVELQNAVFPFLHNVYHIAGSKP